MSEEKSTSELVVEFAVAAVIVPVIVLGAVYLYTLVFDVYLTRQIWKTAFFIAWSGTLLVFFREFLKTYLDYRFRKKRRAKQLDKTLLK